MSRARREWDVRERRNQERGRDRRTRGKLRGRCLVREFATGSRAGRWGLVAGAGWLAGLAVACAPAFEAFLLLRVSGVPMLERLGRDKWGDDPRYRQYCERVSILVPWLPSAPAAEKRRF